MMMKIKKWFHDLVKSNRYGKQIEFAVDQLGHLAWGFMITALYLCATWLNGNTDAGMHVLLAFVLPVVALAPRELIDQWPIESWKDTIADLVFVGLGGVAACLILT
jgi:hypothetical protein